MKKLIPPIRFWICDAVQYAILHSEWKKPRYFAEGIVYTDDAELVQEVYQRYDEDSRLNKSQAARVEFLTAVRYIEKYLTPGAKILDVGAGAGEYSFYFTQNEKGIVDPIAAEPSQGSMHGICS